MYRKIIQRILIALGSNQNGTKVILIVLATLYFISPFDLLPDFIHPLLGRLDDALVMYLCYRFFKRVSGYVQFAKFSQFGRQKTNETASEQSGSKEKQKWDPYKILGIENTDSLMTIKKAYRNKVSQYHPDKVDHLGPEIQAFAKQKTQEIIEAFNYLSKTNRQ
ncbi:DnaJ domain-containing protein [Bacteriovoracaceae bacterium]|nr:DnaJ domain-containing protein [Bacteriovoracaceae bacterium]